MKWLVFALALLVSAEASAIHSPFVLKGPLNGPFVISGGLKTRFFAPLNANGLTAANPATSWPVAGVPAPTVAWWGDDPTGAAGKTTHAFTLTGSTESINTPFCPDGSWSDLTSGCMVAQRFDGANDYYDANTEWGDPRTSDFAVCAVFRDDATLGILVSKQTAGTDDGWALYTNGGDCNVRFDDGTSAIVESANLLSQQAWNFCCGVRDYDGNVFVYANGTIAAPSANTTGDINVAEVVSIGSRYVTHANVFGGGVASVWIWEGSGTPVTETPLDSLYDHFQGILDTHGAPIADSTTVGPIGAVVDGQIEVFGDDWQILGSEMPPGSGSTGPASGLYVAPSQTNSVVQSDNLAVTWTTNDGGGAAVVSAAATSPYRDGRAVSTITDDQAGTVEYAQSAGAAISVLGVGDKITFSVWARDTANTVLDVQTVGYGGCVGDTADHAAVTISPVWTRYTFQHTLADTACTLITIRLSPGDFGVAANTGTADIGAVGIYTNNNTAGGQAYVPPFECPTGAAAVTCGSSILGYTITGKGIVSATGTLVGEVRMSMKFAPAVADNLSGASVYAITDNTAAFSSIVYGTDEKMTTYSSVGAANHAISSNTCAAPGTFCVVDSRRNYDSDVYSITMDGTRVDGSTAAASPAGMTQVRYGRQNSAGATVMTAGFWASEAEIRR